MGEDQGPSRADLRRELAALRDARDRWKAVLDGCRDAIFVSDPDARFVFVNPAACDLTGYTEEELLQMGIPDLHEEMDLGAFHTHHAAILSGKAALTDAEILRKDGSKVPTEFNNRDIVLGGHPHMHTVARDVRVRRRLERALEQARTELVESETILSQILENTHVLAVLFDEDFNYRWVNQAYADSFGQPPETFVGKNHFDVFDDPRDREVFERVKESGEPAVVAGREYPCTFRPDGGQSYWDWTLVPTEGSSGRPPGFVLTVVDVTDSRRANEALVDSERRFRVLFQEAPIGISVGDRSGNHLLVNRAFERMTGYSEAELLAMEFPGNTHPEDVEASKDLRDSLRNEARDQASMDKRYVRKDGTVFWAHTSVSMKQDSDRGFLYTLAMIEDISDRKAAEEAAAREEQLRSALIDHLPHLALVLRKNTREVVYANEQARALGARPGVTCHEACFDRATPCPFCRAPELWETGTAQEAEIRHDSRYLDCRWAPLSDQEYLHYIFDMTARRTMEEEIRASRDRVREFGARLDAVRDEERQALARELHDEVGQSLTAMRMDLSLIEKELPGEWGHLGARIHSLIDVAQDSVDRVNRMSSELRPPVLDLLGLEAAVETEVWIFRDREVAAIDHRLNVEGLKPDEERDTTLIRVLKEALLNIRKHADATSVGVRLEEDGEDVVLEILDDGKGIGKGHIEDPRSFGLMGMRERVERIGGSFTVEPRQGGGTRVFARVSGG